MPRKLLFITGNANKLREVRTILESTSSIELESRDLDLPELQGSIEEVSTGKCKAAAEIVKGPVLVEDTALCFNALKGLPGPYIKWFMKGIGHEGLNNLLAAYEDKSAESVCTFAYCAGQGEEVKIFQGRTTGKIVPPRGPGDFGWDAVFEYEGQTYAEMDKDYKNQISHRGKALKKLADWFSQHEEEVKEQ
ncbi:inosine triphosphate pyrophosphatase-like protein [Kalaharituber pfeilii]|nr:inosine triphosphate pyrophosphatase-like protein [Kalaharituber pfeilii]